MVIPRKWEISFFAQFISYAEFHIWIFIDVTSIRSGKKRNTFVQFMCLYIYIRVYEDDEVWRNDSFSTTKNESWEMYVWNLNIEFNLFFSILLSFQVIKHRRGDFLPVNQFLILKSLELHERIKNCIKNVIKYYEY